MPTWAGRRNFFRLPCSIAAKIGLSMTRHCDPKPTLSGVKGHRVYSLVAIDVYDARHTLALTHEPISRTDFTEVFLCLCPLNEADTCL